MTTIEQLTTMEGERLRTIRLRALRDAADAFASTYDDSAARPEESWTRQLAELATFVAVDDARDVSLVHGGRHDSLGDTACLISMWVASEARGRGVGIMLIDAVVRWARAADYGRVVLDVGTHNSHATALYAPASSRPTKCSRHRVSTSSRFRWSSRSRAVRLPCRCSRKCACVPIWTSPLKARHDPCAT